MFHKHYKINFVGRESSHNGCICELTHTTPILGVDIGATQLCIYNTLNDNPITRMVTIYYADGTVLGPVLMGKVSPGHWRHLSHSGNHWDIILKEVN